eukprot:scaffold98677_cov37-Attheya_sp.AAC.1
MRYPLRRINLEVKLQQRADDLEDIHMEAAIDAELTKTDGPNSKKEHPEKNVLFDNNPNAVTNCLSPFVPYLSMIATENFIWWRQRRIWFSIRECRRQELTAFTVIESWSPSWTYYFVDQSGGRLGHFAFRYEQSMRLVPAVLTLVDVLELDG